MKLIDNKNKEDHWFECLEEVVPFLVFFVRFGYGLFAYDMSSAGLRWSDKALEKIQHQFKLLYDKYRGDSNFVQVRDFDYECGGHRGYIAIIDLDAHELYNFFQELKELEGMLDETGDFPTDNYKPWNYWPNISGIKM